MRLNDVAGLRRVGTRAVALVAIGAAAFAIGACGSESDRPTGAAGAHTAFLPAGAYLRAEAPGCSPRRQR